MNNKKENKKILIVNSHISWGGLGQYSISLADSFTKSKKFDVYGLVTHSNQDRFLSFKKATLKTLCLANKSKIIKYFLAWIYIWRLRPDILLINYNATVHFLLPFLPPTKVISVIHSDDKDYYRIASINSRYVDTWVAPSPKTREGLLNYLGNMKFAIRIKLIAHGVAGSNEKSNRHINNDLFRIIYIGALYRHKGVDLLPDIFHKFLEINPNSKLTIVGDGHLRNIIADDFKKREIYDRNVTFTGIIDTTSVRSQLANSDVLLFPTRLEGFGLVVTEAMMEGVVPIVSRLSGITDAIITDSEDGFLAEEDNVNNFVEFLSNLYNDRLKLLKMAQNTQLKAKNKYSLNSMITSYESLFDYLLNN